MKKRESIVLSFIFLLFLPLAFSQPGEIRTFVNDYAEILTPAQEQELASLLLEISNSGAAEYVVVTVSSLEGESLESYSLRLAQEKIGSKEKNNGLLLLVAVEDREYRFEVGRGLEGVLNDAKIGRIGRTYLVPYFRKGNYDQGILEASKSVKSILLQEAESSYYLRDEEASTGGWSNTLVNLLLIAGFFFVVLIIIVISRMRKGRYSAAGYYDRRRRRFGRGRFGGGSSPGGGSSSGGGSFGGGGRFGGGGASGRW